jgi:hypothetical protein
MWLVAESLHLAIHPMTALPYMLARVEEGDGLGFEAHTSAALRRIREPYRRLFPARRRGRRGVPVPRLAGRVDPGPRAAAAPRR